MPIDKEALIKEAGDKAIAEVARVLQINPTLESVTPVMELAMGSNLLKVYKLSLYYGIEGDRCFEQGAFFASCLLTVATNEAFLTLTCLQEQKAVESTAAFRGLRKPSKSFDQVIAEFGLDRLIKVSNELGWIPKDVVNSDLLGAIVQDFPKLAKTVYPGWTWLQISEKLNAFRAAPGPEMLKVMQDMRNLVHATRWLKTGSILDDIEFEENCKLAVLVGREIVHCLSLRTMNMFQKSLHKLQAFDDLPDEIKARVRELMLSGLQMK